MVPCYSSLGVCCFAVSVVTGMIGSIGLLRRSSIAILCFGISLGAVVIQMGYTMLIAGGLEIMGPSGGVMPVWSFRYQRFGYSLESIATPRGCCRGWVRR